MFGRIRPFLLLLTLGMAAIVVACGPGSNSALVVLATGTPVPGASLTTTGFLPAGQATAYPVPVPANGAITSLTVGLPTLSSPTRFTTTIASGIAPSGVPGLDIARQTFAKRSVLDGTTTVPLLFAVFSMADATAVPNSNGVYLFAFGVSSKAFPTVFFDCGTDDCIDTLPGVTLHVEVWDGTKLELDPVKITSVVKVVTAFGPRDDDEIVAITYNDQNIAALKPNTTYWIYFYATAPAVTATPNPSATPAATPSATPTPSPTPSPTPTPTPRPTMAAAPVSVALPGMGAPNAQTFTVSESGFSGTFSASGCGGVATASVGATASGSATVTVTGSAGGSCSLTIGDGVQTITVPVTVSVTTVGGS